METINIFYVIVTLLILGVIFSCAVSVQQGYIYVLTMFGKYQRILRPGLNFKIPFLEQVYKKISIQNRSVELEFQAVTADQANVYFKSMLLYAVQNADEETVKRVAFKFIADRDLMQALTRGAPPSGAMRRSTGAQSSRAAGKSLPTESCPP